MAYDIIGQGAIPDYCGNLPHAYLHECQTLEEADAWIRSYTRRDLGGWDLIIAMRSDGVIKIEASEFGVMYY